MATESIIAQIDAEIARLSQVRMLLAGTGEVSSAISGVKNPTLSSKKRRKHVLSPEARAKIAEAQRRRWAAQKTKSKVKTK